jgi:DNA-directed RNA polymerase specialized sigma24 family protein
VEPVPEDLRPLLERWRQPVYALYERTREPSAAVDAAAGVLAELARTPADAEDAGLDPYRLVWRRLKDEPASPPPVVPARRLAESLGARTAMLRGAVAALPPAERALFLFTRIGGLPVEAAAKVVGVPREEARRLLVRAFDGVRAALRPLLELPASEPEVTPLSARGGSR